MSWQVLSTTFDQLNVSQQNWNDIYNGGGWADLGSGPGSRAYVNVDLVSYLSDFIQNNNVLSFLDLGCGDLQWVNGIFSNTFSYTGVDYCMNFFSDVTANYPDQTFLNEDFMQTTQSSELVFVKDVIHHCMDNMVQVFDKVEQLSTRFGMIVVPFQLKDDSSFITHVNNFGYSCVFEYVADEKKCLFLKIK